MNLNFNGLLEPQKNHATKLLNSLHMNGFAFDASPTGTGKTYCASWIAKNYGSTVVVLCPKSVQKSWVDTLKSFGIEDPIVMTIEKLVRGKTKYYTYDSMDKYVQRTYKQYWQSNSINTNFPSNSLVIMDEVHKCKGRNSLNAEALIALKNAGHKLLMLSASAATNVTEMKSFGYVTALHNGLGFNNFCKDNGVDFNRFGLGTWDANLKKCKEGMVRIHNTLFDTLGCASRMNRKDFGDIFPDNQVIADGFDIGSNTDKLKEVYNEMEYELMNLDESSKGYKEHHFSIIMKARRASELLKIPAMSDWIEDMYDECVSPVIFVNFTESLSAIEKRLNKTKFAGKISKIIGGQTDKCRNLQIERFQKDETRIMLITLQSGAASISLHDLNGNYPRYTLINPSFSAVNILQALGRCHRVNGKTSVLQKLFFANGIEIEEKMRKRVNLRLSNLDNLNDGDLDISLSMKF
jgi:Type III restriction enzyme, res subunit